MRRVIVIGCLGELIKRSVKFMVKFYLYRREWDIVEHLKTIISLSHNVFSRPVLSFLEGPRELSKIMFAQSRQVAIGGQDCEILGSFPQV